MSDYERTPGAQADDDPFSMIRLVLESVSLLPESYATYQPLLVDALLFFFERLPSARLEDIIVTQAAFEFEADPNDRLSALLRQCPTLHKLGQVLSHERGLPLALRERLQDLESLPPSTELGEIQAIVEREIGHVNGLSVASTALAEGSVAVVIPFTLNDGTGPERAGILKVLKPRAVARMREELAIWPELSPFLVERSRTYGLPVLDYRGMLEGVANLLLNEIQLEREQETLSWAMAFYAGEPDVVIPGLFAFSTPHVTAMERVDGRKITDPSIPSHVRRHVAKTLVEALIAKPFWHAGDAPAKFHADPHAGNLFVTDDGRLAILDWALTTELAETELSGVVRALAGAATLDESATLAAIATLGNVLDERACRLAIADALAEVRRGVFPAFVWLLALLDRLARAATVTFPERTALFRKSLLTLTGVVADVHGGAHIDDVLVRSGATQFVSELQHRLRPATSTQRYGTHLTNADLGRLWLSLPWTPTRYWLESWRDILTCDRPTPARHTFGLMP